MFNRLESIKFIKERNKFGSCEVRNIVTLSMNAQTTEWVSAVEDGNQWALFTGNSLDQLDSFFRKLSLAAACNELKHMYGPEDMAHVYRRNDRHPVIHVYDHNFESDFHILRNMYSESFNENVFAPAMYKPLNATAMVLRTPIMFHATSRLFPIDLKDMQAEYDLKQEYYSEYTMYSDVLTLGNAIMDQRTTYGRLSNIPVTEPAAVRRQLKNSVIKDKTWIKTCQETTASYTFDMYDRLCKAYFGGSVGVNRKVKGFVLNNVDSFDATSMYPFHMATKKFPVSPWEITEDDTDADYAYIYEISADNVQCKMTNAFLPIAQCYAEGETTDGHMLVSASHIETTLTDIDFKLFKSMYDADITVNAIYRSKLEYLPKGIIKLILMNFAAKSTKKNTAKYKRAKRFINNIYGAFVVKTITDTIEYRDNEWHKIKLTEESFAQKIEEESKKKLFTTYQIGVWVTAYARQMLWNIIQHCDSHVVYFDTDCVKGIFTEEEKDFIRNYSELNVPYDFDESLYTVNGCTLGQFKHEYTADEFKAIAPKIYAVYADGKLETTIAGLDKKLGKKAIKSVDDLRYGLKIQNARKQVTYEFDGNTYTIKECRIDFTLNDGMEETVIPMINTGYNNYTSTLTEVFMDRRKRRAS